MKEHKQVLYSFEHGDETLPRLKDLVSEVADPEKSIILSYLRLHCILVCPRIVHDEIDPNKTIGHGYIFSDGTYFWTDVFTNYVNRYNIPVPEDFRNHILQNYTIRMKRHMQLRLIDSIEIQNTPYPGCKYYVRINKNGVIEYHNSEDCKNPVVINIKPENAEYIIEPITTELFCYDVDGHGQPIAGGYHWKIIFYKKEKVIDEVEGWPGEDEWRYGQIKKIIEFSERYIPQELGSKNMNYYESKE